MHVNPFAAPECGDAPTNVRRQWAWVKPLWWQIPLWIASGSFGACIGHGLYPVVRPAFVALGLLPRHRVPLPPPPPPFFVPAEPPNDAAGDEVK